MPLGHYWPLEPAASVFLKMFVLQLWTVKYAERLCDVVCPIYFFFHDVCLTEFNLRLCWTMLNVFEHTATTWLTPRRSRCSPGDDRAECVETEELYLYVSLWACVGDERDALWPQAPIKNRFRLLWRYRWTEVLYEIFSEWWMDWTFYTSSREQAVLWMCHMFQGLT